MSASDYPAAESPPPYHSRPRHRSQEFKVTSHTECRSFNPLSPNSDQHQFSPNNIHTLSKERLWELIKWSPKRKFFDRLSNSLNSFFKEIYRDQFGELVCWYWGLNFLVPLPIHKTHAPVELWRIYQTNLQRSTEYNNFWWVLQALHWNLKNLAQLFQVLIHVHPCHPLQQTTGTGPSVRGCLHDAAATFTPARVHSGSLSWLYICLHDTTTKCHAGASHPGVSSPRLLYRGENFTPARNLATESCKRESSRLERVAHA